MRIINGQLYFDDRNTDLHTSFENLNLKLKAKYNQKNIILDTKLDTEHLTLRKDGEVFINDLSVGIYGDIQVSRQNKTMHVNQTKVSIGDIDFIATGKIVPVKGKKEVDVQLDLALKVPSINSIVKLIPESILKRKNTFKSKGKVSFVGKINGIYGNGNIPVIQGDMKIHKGQLAYDDMPNKIDLIEASLSLFIDPSKNLPSFIDFSKLNIKGDKIDIHMNGKIENVLENSKVTFESKGFVDLNSLSQTFPLRDSVAIKGKIESDVQATFSPKDIKDKTYTNIIANGKLSLVDVKYVYKTDSIIFESKNSKVEFIKDKNNQKFTETNSDIIGGRINLNGFRWNVKNSIALSADQFLMEYEGQKSKDTTKTYLIYSKINLKNIHFNLKDTIVGMILKSNAKITQKPSDSVDKEANIHSDFYIDSIGLKINNNFFAITSGYYNIDLVKKPKQRWPVSGEIDFDKMYAFSPSFPLLLKMPQTTIKIINNNIELVHAKIELGNSDFEVTGKIIDYGKMLFDDKKLIMKMDVKSDVVDANEIIRTFNKGIETENKKVDDLLVASNSNIIEDNTKPKTFVIPKRIDFEFNSSIAKVLFKKQIIENFKGIVTIKNQIFELEKLHAQISKAKIISKVRLTTKVNKAPSLAFDFNLNNINLKELINIMPVIDSLLPMAKSIGGNVNFRIRGVTVLDKNIEMLASSLAAISRIEGENMVVMNSETFEKISEKLWFKNKEKNIIDEISVEILIKDKVIEILPAQVFIDRYRIAVGGIYNLDQTYNYQFSILKSPLPFKAGIDMIGDEEDYKFKLTRAKYKRIFSKKKRHLKKIDSTLIKKKIEIIKQLPF